MLLFDLLWRTVNQPSSQNLSADELWWVISVKKRQTASQPHKHISTTYFLTLTVYSFADFLFLTAFPWELTIGISLPCPSCLPARASSLHCLSYSFLLSLLFCDVLYKANITQSLCCMQNDHINAFVLLKTREIFTKMFIYCTSGSVNWFASVYKSWDFGINFGIYPVFYVYICRVNFSMG